MCKILIAEDEYQIARFMERGLRKYGFRTEIAGDGEEALAMVKSSNFDLILLDLGLPLVDGLTVLKQIRRQGLQMPIIIVTASENIRNKQAAIQAGANDYVKKPFRFGDLCQRIDRQLRTRKLFSA